ncbi:hypothetical protein THAOC_03032 [Thalassiosira oceanica]|uniref:Glycosyltransferase family 92 protein n=1 Tax=Thalassiosira oceanica TaxID=159749 RepID=K0TDR6_THAOC|nr:hypothetical protein THAOC_03032 [Thalassiosira oceanica]|eukprot:EJK75249.1 hypothetical protein THAOC_03032 [Thalassiosira oceanica]
MDSDGFLCLSIGFPVSGEHRRGSGDPAEMGWGKVKKRKFTTLTPLISPPAPPHRPLPNGGRPLGGSSSMARPAKRGGGTGTRPYLFFVAFALALSLANYRLSSRLEDFVGDRPDGGGDSRHASLRGGLSDFRRTGSMGTRGSRVSARTKGDTRRYAYSPLKGERYNFTVAICAIVKDGEAYLNEWLDYHLDALGIEMAVIYDNSWNFEVRDGMFEWLRCSVEPCADLRLNTNAPTKMETWYNNTRAHPVYGRVEVRPSRDIHDPKRQKRAYTDCILRYGRNVPEGAVNYNQDQMGLVNVTDRALPPRRGRRLLRADRRRRVPGPKRSLRFSPRGSARLRRAVRPGGCPDCQLDALRDGQPYAVHAGAGPEAVPVPGREGPRRHQDDRAELRVLQHEDSPLDRFVRERPHDVPSRIDPAQQRVQDGGERRRVALVRASPAPLPVHV